MKTVISILMIVASSLLCAISFRKDKEYDVPTAWYVVFAIWLILLGFRIWID